MQLPLEITFRHFPPSAAIEAKVRREAARLEKFYTHIMACRVVVESPHRHHHQGKRYRVWVDVTVPGGEIVVSHQHHDRQAQSNSCFHLKTMR